MILIEAGNPPSLSGRRARTIQRSLSILRGRRRSPRLRFGRLPSHGGGAWLADMRHRVSEVRDRMIIGG